MKQLYPYLFIITIILFSCNRTKSTIASEEVIDSLSLNSYRIENPITTVLTPSAKRGLATWKEYQDVDEFLLTYYNISVSEALGKAEELSNLVKLMKDTIRVENLEKQNVIARFNVLYNETLRLADMATIPSISDEEVAEEVTQILNIYAAVNDKINIIYKAEDLQNALEVDTETPIEIVIEGENGDNGYIPKINPTKENTPKKDLPKTNLPKREPPKINPPKMNKQ
jgi:hypothetical protein